MALQFYVSIQAFPNEHAHRCSKKIKENVTTFDQYTLQIGWFGHPIFSKRGNYPQIMIDRIAALSKEQGFTKSRLPKFTREEILRIRGTSDFFGVNSYTTNQVYKNDHNNSASFPVPSFFHDMGVVEKFYTEWPGSGSVWLHVSTTFSYYLSASFDLHNIIRAGYNFNQVVGWLSGTIGITEEVVWSGNKNLLHHYILKEEICMMYYLLCVVGLKTGLESMV